MPFRVGDHFLVLRVPAKIVFLMCFCLHLCIFMYFFGAISGGGPYPCAQGASKKRVFCTFYGFYVIYCRPEGKGGLTGFARGVPSRLFHGFWMDLGGTLATFWLLFGTFCKTVPLHKPSLKFRYLLRFIGLGGSRGARSGTFELTFKWFGPLSRTYCPIAGKSDLSGSAHQLPGFWSGGDEPWQTKAQGEDNRRGREQTKHTTRLVTPKGSADIRGHC